MPIGTSLIFFKLWDFALFKITMHVDFNLSGALKLLCAQVAHLGRRVKMCFVIGHVPSILFLFSCSSPNGFINIFIKVC